MLRGIKMEKLKWRWKGEEGSLAWEARITALVIAFVLGRLGAWLLPQWIIGFLAGYDSSLEENDIFHYHCYGRNIYSDL